MSLHQSDRSRREVIVLPRGGAASSIRFSIVHSLLIPLICVFMLVGEARVAVLASAADRSERRDDLTYRDLVRQELPDASVVAIIQRTQREAPFQSVRCEMRDEAGLVLAATDYVSQHFPNQGDCWIGDPWPIPHSIIVSNDHSVAYCILRDLEDPSSPVSMLMLRVAVLDLKSKSFGKFEALHFGDRLFLRVRAIPETPLILVESMWKGWHRAADSEKSRGRDYFVQVFDAELQQVGERVLSLAALPAERRSDPEVFSQITMGKIDLITLQPQRIIAMLGDAERAEFVLTNVRDQWEMVDADIQVRPGAP